MGESPDPFWNSIQGTIDEVRISDTPRSADWIKTEYNNQSDTAIAADKFIKILGVEEKGPLSTLAEVTTLTATLASRGGVRLQWQTSYEVDNLGFHVYR